MDENATRAAVRALYQQHGYLSEPHGAVAWAALEASRQPAEIGLFLGTAHPAKFQASVEEILGIDLELPAALAAVAARPVLSTHIKAEAGVLRAVLEKG